VGEGTCGAGQVAAVEVEGDRSAFEVGRPPAEGHVWGETVGEAAERDGGQESGCWGLGDRRVGADKWI